MIGGLIGIWVTGAFIAAMGLGLSHAQDGGHNLTFHECAFCAVFWPLALLAACYIGFHRLAGRLKRMEG